MNRRCWRFAWLGLTRRAAYNRVYSRTTRGCSVVLVLGLGGMALAAATWPEIA